MKPSEQIRSQAKRMALMRTQQGADKALLAEEYTDILLARAKSVEHAHRIVEQAKAKWDFAPTIKELNELIDSQPVSSGAVEPDYTCLGCRGGGFSRVYFLRTRIRRDGMPTGWIRERIERENRSELDFQTHLRFLAGRLDPKSQEIVPCVERCRCAYGQFLSAQGRGITGV